jgi:hypothetical protein
MVRIVASYTTLPSRYEVLYMSIMTLKKQTRPPDAIYVALPKRAARLNIDYPPLPAHFDGLCTVVHTEVDYGPLTKIYGALMAETDPDTIIISCDDDVFFDPTHIEVMLRHHKQHPHCCICGTGALISRGMLFISIVSSIQPFHKWRGFTGFTVDKEGRKVDLIFGAAGVLYTRGMFPIKEQLFEELLSHALNDSAIFHNDDVLISGYLSKKNIGRRVFLDIPSVQHANGADALSGDLQKMVRRMELSIDKVKERGFYPQMEELSMTETPAGRAVFALIVLYIILLVIIGLYRSTY